MANTQARTRLEALIAQMAERIDVLEHNQDVMLDALEETNLRLLFVLRSVQVKRTIASSALALTPQVEEGTLETFFKKDHATFRAAIQKERAAHVAPPAGAHDAATGRTVTIDAAQAARRTH